jgi:nitroreductase
MQTLSPEALVSQLQWRYATKQFDPSRRIAADVWDKLEKALVLTPSSFGLQPWKFVVIGSPTVKKQLVSCSWNQTQPADCSHHVVFAARTKLSETDIDAYLKGIVAARGVTLESLAGFRSMLAGFVAKLAAAGSLQEWAIRQVYIALGNFMTSCAVLGIDSCPMEGIQPEKYDEILGLSQEGFTTVVACAAGYRLQGDKNASLPKVRMLASEVIKHV